MYSRTSFIVQIIYFYSVVEIGGYILNNQKILSDLDSFSKPSFFDHLVPIDRFITGYTKRRLLVGE